MERRRSRKPPSRPLVLLVDDYEATRDLYVAGLTTLGFEAVGADDCARACKRASELRPDIIVTDLSLRGGDDGWDLLERLKDDLRTRDIPVVVVTGYATPSFRERAETRHLPRRLAIECDPKARRVLRARAQ